MKPNSKWFVLSSLLFLFLAYALHKPFPAGFCKSPLDRAILYVIEPFLRVTYYWPSLAFFTKATDRVWWTRNIFVALSPIMSLKWDSHGTIKTETVQWAGVTTRVYSPKENATTDGAVVFIHGGGFAIGDIYLYDSLTKRMAAMLNSVVISIDYRLSPETVYPGQLTDCEGVLEHFIEVAKDNYGVDTNKIVIMGDSAGGNLAAVITQRRKLRGAVPQLLGQVLLYPLLQLADLQSTSYRYYHKHLDGFAFVDPASVALYYMFYAGIDMNKHGHLVDHILTNSHVKNEHRDKINKYLRFEEFSHLNYSGAEIPPKQVAGPHSELQEIMAPWVVNPEFSPIMREDLSGLPKALVVTCEYDVLRDEGMMYARRLEEAGVPTTHKNYVNGFHAMLNFHWEIDEAYKATEEIIEWVRQVLVSA